MKCTRCSSDRIFKMDSKSSDCNSWSFQHFDGDRYAPILPGICGGDYVRIQVCLECGQLQGSFPIDSKALERHHKQDIIDSFWDNYSVDESIDVFLAEQINVGHRRYADVIYYQDRAGRYTEVSFGAGFPLCGDARVTNTLNPNIDIYCSFKLTRT